MPLRKEVKEAVIYPPSKRKAPPFKPQRPNKIVRTSTNVSDTSEATRSADNSTTVSRSDTMNDRRQSPIQQAPKTMSKTASESVDLLSDSEIDIQDSSDDLPDDPLKAATLKKVAEPAQRPAVKPTAVASRATTVLEPDVVPPDIDQEATIPQRLLLRLLHENFTSQDTKIDKHAIAILQQYVDIFIRETVARSAINKKDEIDNGQASQSDANWLERDNLEKVAGGMLLDF